MCLCLWRTSRLINIRIQWSNKLSSVYGLSLTTVPYFSLGSAAYKPSKLQGVLQLERCALLPPDIPALTRFWFGLSHPEGISDPPKDGCVSVCGVRLSSLASALNGRINCRLLMGCPWPLSRTSPLGREVGNRRWGRSVTWWRGISPWSDLKWSDHILQLIHLLMQGRILLYHLQGLMSCRGGYPDLFTGLWNLTGGRKPACLLHGIWEYHPKRGVSGTVACRG